MQTGRFCRQGTSEGAGLEMLNWMAGGSRTRACPGAAREPSGLSGRNVAGLALLATIGFSSLGGVVEAKAQGALASDNEATRIRRVSITLFKSRTVRSENPFATA